MKVLILIAAVLVLPNVMSPQAFNVVFGLLCAVMVLLALRKKAREMDAADLRERSARARVKGFRPLDVPRKRRSTRAAVSVAHVPAGPVQLYDYARTAGSPFAGLPGFIAPNTYADPTTRLTH